MNKTENLQSSKWIQKDRKVWVKAQSNFKNPFEDAFLEGTVLSTPQVEEKNARVLLEESKEQHMVDLQSLIKLTYGPKCVADMVDLEELNEPQLLYNIKRRYIDDMIFTYCGPTLLIINPYIYIENLFNDSVLHEYQSLVFTDTLEYKNLAPHIFGLAAFCLWQLFDNQRNQSIVISGQSGAGKTENTKYCLKFLASLGKNMKQITSDTSKRVKMNHNLRAAQKAIKKTSSKVFGIQEKILGCNQILEAFGNAKTIRNDNSSRFGKLILLVYGQTQIEIKSAYIISYLLEKSRIVSVSEGERNYHVFYYFCKGTSAEEKKKYMLKDNTSDYYYLNQSTVNSLPNKSDQDQFSALQRQFKHYLSNDQVEAVMIILSVVLNTGNLKFKKEENKNNQQVAVIQNIEYLQIVGKLLQVDTKALEHCFMFKTRKMGMNVINSPLKYDEALSLRDSFAKNIYEKTFNFLIQRLNQKIEIQPVDISQNGAYRKSIGLLDIFGFEVLTINSLEQFLINFANQKLQQLYVSYIFKEEQNEFMKQGLKEHTHDIGFQDNKPIIDLFESSPLGIFNLINQSSELNQSDADMPESIARSHKNNQFLKIPKSKRSMFEIIHSCSPVSYTTTGFTAKNKDQFPQQLLGVIETSTNVALRTICSGNASKELVETKSRATSKKFLGSKFLNEMNKLIFELYSCDCHFVRCIKPNSKKSPKLFNSHAVLQSLRYLGVLDSIIIRKLGYIYRRPFKEFYKKFYELDKYIFSYHSDSKGMKEDDFKVESQKIINKHAKKQFEDNFILFGHKKILIKQSTLNHLQCLVKEKRKARINTANRFNIMYKNAVFRTRVKMLMKTIKTMKTHMKLLVSDIREKIAHDRIVKIQNVVKKFLWQRRLEKIKEQATKSVTKISAYYKIKKQRNIFLDIRSKCIGLQALIRSYLAMGKYFRTKTCNTVIMEIFEQSWHNIQVTKAIMIQRNWKGYKTRKQYKQAIQIMQKNIRLSKIRAKFKRALFQHNYNKFRDALNRYKRPILMMQAVVRGRYMHRVYNQVLKSSLLIRRAYRRHLKKRFYLSRYWQQYRQLIGQNESLKIKEMMKLGINLSSSLDSQSKIRSIQETTGLHIRLKPSQMMLKYGTQHIKNQQQLQQQVRKQHKYADWSINQTIKFADKNSFQVYVADYDCLSNEGYKGEWFDKFSKVKHEIHKKMQFPIHVELSGAVSTVTTNKDKVYRFQSSQNTKESRQEPNTQYFEKVGCLVRVSSIGSSTYILTQQQKMYRWGPVKSKQTSVIASDSYHQQQAKSTIEERFLVPRTDVVKVAQCYYKSALIMLNLDSQGNVTMKNEHDTSSKGKEHESILKFPSDRVEVKQMAASYFFVHFLSVSGLVFSMGRNTRGELGLGMSTTQPIFEPTLNDELKKQKQCIETISAGMSHTVAKSKLGYIYLWGSNAFGQLGGLNSNGQDCQLKPKCLLDPQKRTFKAFQAVAGIRATYMLSEGLKVTALGCSLAFDTCQSGEPEELRYFQQTSSVKPSNLAILKISCSWTRQQSLLTVNCLDLTQCKPGNKPDAILKHCKSIAKQWVDDSVYPIYHEFMDNVLNLSDMRKLKFKSNQSTQNNATKKGVKKTNQKQSRLDELRMLVDLKNSSSMFRGAARDRVQTYMSQLNSKRPEQWTMEEKQLHKFILEECKQILK